MSTNLTLGSRGNEVIALQQYLKNQGLYTGAIDGIYGPKTMNAVHTYQKNQNLKVDGIAGPETLGNIKAHSSVTKTIEKAMQNPDVAKIVANDPVASKTMNQLLNNDLTGLVDESGKPYSTDTVNKIYSESLAELDPAYKQELQKERGDVESQLLSNQSSLDRYLTNSANTFQENKNQLDQNAAKNGILFSTGRTQKENALANATASAEAEARDKLVKSSSDLLRDYQYKYGKAPTDSLASYSTLKTPNTYNANVARGGISTGGLSSIYNTGSYDLYGTNPRKQASEAAVRTANKLGAYSAKSSRSPLTSL